ncbi:hypothetical protein ACLKA6_002328 [Drosophila palustris]
MIICDCLGHCNNTDATYTELQRSNKPTPLLVQGCLNVHTEPSKVWTDTPFGYLITPLTSRVFWDISTHVETMPKRLPGKCPSCLRPVKPLASLEGRLSFVAIQLASQAQLSNPD